MDIRRRIITRRRRGLLPVTFEGVCPVCNTSEQVLKDSDSSWRRRQLREGDVRSASIEGLRRGRQTDYFRKLEEKVRAIWREWFHVDTD